VTIIIDDAGSGDLLFGVVIGVFRSETGEFKYNIVEVNFFQPPKFRKKEYLNQASKIIFQLLNELKVKPGEQIQICRGYIFDKALLDLKKEYGEENVHKVKVQGELQGLVETSYLDELRNLGYEPIKEREKKRAKSFFHMMRWVNKNPQKIEFVKTGWPRLLRYKIFKKLLIGLETK
jgi:hypothetical protein